MNEDFMPLEDFPAAMARVECFFHVDRCLPDQVFKQPFRFQLLHHNSSLWYLLAILKNLGSPLLGDTILLNVLDPHPIDYFYKHFGKINAFTFKADISEQNSAAMCRLSPGNEAEAIMYHWNVQTAIPSSGAWTIWSEYGREIDVIGLDDPALVSHLIDDKGFWMDAETAINDAFARAPYKDQKAPEAFVKALIENYGSRAELEAKLGGKIRYHWELE